MKHLFYVGEVKVPVLGMGFLKHYCAIIDAHTGEIRMASHTAVEMAQQETGNEGFTSILAATKVDNPGVKRSVKVILAEDLVPKLGTSMQQSIPFNCEDILIH